MGDIANMVDYDGRISGERLLRWLRSRAETEHQSAQRWVERGSKVGMWGCTARRDLLMEMADDLERELTPPDYPEDDGNALPSFMNGPHDPHKRSPGADDEEPERPCPNCRGRGTVALEPGNLNTLYWPCQACKGTGNDCTVGDDAIDLDGLAPTGGPEESQPEGPAYRDFAPGREDDPEAYREMVQQERAEEEAGLSIRRRKQE